MSVQPGQEFDDRFGDRWFPVVNFGSDGHHRWLRLRDGCTLEVNDGRVEIAWTLNHFVQYQAEDPLGWITDHLCSTVGPVMAVSVQ